MANLSEEDIARLKELSRRKREEGGRYPAVPQHPAGYLMRGLHRVGRTMGPPVGTIAATVLSPLKLLDEAAVKAENILFHGGEDVAKATLTSGVPDIRNVPEASRAFWELAGQGDWDAAIGQYYDEMGGGRGYWGASELAGAMLPTGIPSRIGTGLKALSRAPALAETVARVLPKAVSPRVASGISTGLRRTGKALRAPWELEEAIGRAALYPLKLGWRGLKATPQAIRGIRGKYGREAAEEVVEAAQPGDVQRLDDIIDTADPTPRPRPTEDPITDPRVAEDIQMADELLGPTPTVRTQKNYINLIDEETNELLELPAVYLRFGDLPPGDTPSFNQFLQQPEEGVSVYKAWYDPKTRKYVLASDADGAQESLIASLDIPEEGMKILEVEGEYLGLSGYDFEDLLTPGSVRVVREISPSQIVFEVEPRLLITGDELDPSQVPNWSTPAVRATSAEKAPPGPRSYRWDADKETMVPVPPKELQEARKLWKEALEAWRQRRYSTPTTAARGPVTGARVVGEAVEEAVTPVENLIPSVGDATTGKVRLYHGSPNTVEAFDLSLANEHSLYGPGVYLTADPKIASGYARKRPRPGVEAAPNIQAVTVRLRKVFDVDAPADKELLEGLQKDWAEYVDDPPYWSEGRVSEETFDLLEGKISNPTNKQVYRMMVEFSDPSYPKIEANDLLSQHGFDGITHIGGGITGRPPHRVVIAIGDKFQEVDKVITPAMGDMPTPTAPVTGVAGKPLIAEEAVPSITPEGVPGIEDIIDTAPRTGARATVVEQAGGNTQRLDPNVGSRAEAQAAVATELFDAVPGSRLDAASTAFGKSADQVRSGVDNMAATMKAMDIQRVDPAFESAPIRKVGRFTRYFTDPTRLLQAIDQGVFGGAVQRFILWPTRRTDMAAKIFAQGHKVVFRKMLERFQMVDNLAEQLPLGVGHTKRLRKLAGDVLEEISADDARLSVGELMARPAIKRWLRNITEQERIRVVGFAKEVRPFLDDLLVKQNKIRVARGQAPIPYVEKYRPWLRTNNVWARMGFGKTAEQFGKQAEIPDFVTPDKWFNPRAQERGGLAGYSKEKDLLRLVDDYIETSARDIFYTNIIMNAKAHVKSLRARGHVSAAKAIEQWIAESYAGVKPFISKTAIKGEELVGGKLPIRKGMFAIRKNLTRAVFPMNWTWNLVTQTGSIANTIMRYGVIRTVQGGKYLFNSQVRDDIRSNAYSAFTKQQRTGRAVYQDTGVGIERMAELERKPIEKAEDFANYLTNKIEEILTGVSVQAARKEGEALGLRGRALWEYASEGGAKTQSMYNVADVAGLLRAPEVGAVAPFQTFAFDMMNNVREAMPFLPTRWRVGAYRGARLQSGKIVQTSITGAQNRIKALARWTAGITVLAMISDKTTGRQPWQLGSFLPFWGMATQGVGVGNPYNKPLPYKYVADFRHAVRALTKYGNWKELREWVIGYHMIGGTQVNRMIKGIEAMADGKVTDVRGDTLFDIEPPEGWEESRGLWGAVPAKPWETFKAITQGPYAVTGGKEYQDGLKGGFVKNILGLNVGTWSESDEAERNRLVGQYELDIGGDRTSYFDVDKHRLVRNAIKQRLPTLRDKVDEYVLSSDAERKKLATTAEFMAIRDALSAEYGSGGTIDRLRKAFLQEAPIGWWYVAALAGVPFPGSRRLRDAINAWIEAGNEFPDIDMRTFEGDLEALNRALR